MSSHMEELEFESEREQLLDMVNSPEHYRKGKWEAIDIIEEYFKDNYHLGTVLKYLIRHKHKGHPKQDLEKARWYLDRYIASL